MRSCRPFAEYHYNRLDKKKYWRTWETWDIKYDWKDCGTQEHLEIDHIVWVVAESVTKLCLWALNQAFLTSGSEEGDRGGFTIRNAHRKEATGVLENEHRGGETEQGSGSDHAVRTCC